MDREYIPKNKCAPCSIKNKNKNMDWKSCYSKASLISIADAWNKENPSLKPIVYKGKNHIQIWKQINERLYKKCKEDEECWNKQEFIKKMKNSEIDYYTFKPEYPEEWYKDKYTWLNTYDILYVMKQFQKVYKDFIFLGPIPSDCPTRVQCKLSNFDLMKLKRNKINKVGIIYNLDVSSGEGTHWVALYIHIPKKEINYYDSYGHKPIHLIHEFIMGLVMNFRENNKEPTVIYNDTRHQYKGSECGMYSMNFILERLNGKSMKDISSVAIPDEEVNNLRKFLFNYKKN